MLAALLKAKT